MGDISAISATTGRNFLEDPGLHRTLIGDGLATAMLIFRADTLPVAWSMFLSMFRPNTEASPRRIFNAQGLPYHQLDIILMGVVLVFVVSILQERGVSIREWIARRALPIRWSIYIAAVLVVIIAGAYGPGFGVVDFIYAQF